jgi:hypothetical protein
MEETRAEEYDEDDIRVLLDVVELGYSSMPHVNIPTNGQFGKEIQTSKSNWDMQHQANWQKRNRPMAVKR